MLKAAKKMKKDKKKANATLSQALSAALLAALVAHAPAAHSSEVARSPYFGFSVCTLFLFLCIRFFPYLTVITNIECLCAVLQLMACQIILI